MKNAWAMEKQVRKVLTLAAALLACVSVNAEAAIYFQNTIGQSGSGTFDAFDTSLGTLTGVSIQFNTQTQFIGDFTPLTSDGSTYSVSTTGDGVMNVTAGGLSWSLVSQPYAEQSAFVTSQTLVGFSGDDFQSQSITDPVSLAAFISGPVSYNFSVSATPTFGDLTEFSFYDVTSSAVEASLTYEYTVAAVPEPETWMMMLCGFGAIGGVLRQRRRQSKQARPALNG